MDQPHWPQTEVLDREFAEDLAVDEMQRFTTSIPAVSSSATGSQSSLMASGEAPNSSLQALKLNPYNSSAYSNLAATLSSRDCIQLLDGTWMSARQLYRRAIILDAENSRAYCNLGALLKKGERVDLPCGSLTDQKLYLKAIHIDPDDAKAYAYLAATLRAGEHIRLLNHRLMSKEDLIRMSSLR